MIHIIEGATGTGKTRYLNTLGRTNKNTLSSQELLDKLLLIGKESFTIEQMVAELSSIRFIENLESLRGKEASQKLAAHLIAAMAEGRDVYVTAIDPENSVPFFLQLLTSSYTRRTFTL